MTTGAGASDATYHQRHSRRSLRRAASIAANVSGPVSVLDVGCNIGITSRHLLETGLATHVTGIELDAATVDAALKTDDRFTLIEGNITDIEPGGPFDVVVYGAVHHHVLNYHGLDAAVAVLQKLADCAGRTLFFETGHLAEGGRWSWQRAMRQYFSSDEEHLNYLLSCIEHRVQDFSVIGRYWIHGARRAYLRIDLKPGAERDSMAVPAPVIPLTVTPGTGKGRTFGSRRQRLLPEAEAGASPTWFGHAEGDDGEALFLKRHRHRPLAALREYEIGAQLQVDWAVRPVGVSEDRQTLVFPRIEGRSPANSGSTAGRQAIAAQLLRLHADAAQASLTLDSHCLLQLPDGATLLDACDFHANNVLVTGPEAAPVLRVVDFELHGVACRPRNHLHLARCLWSLRTQRLRATAHFLRGLVGTTWQLVANQFRDFSARVRDRRPGLLSLLVVRVRSVTGRLVGRLLRLAGIE